MPEPKHPLKVFLCHAHDDKAKTRELYRYLRRRGVQPWLDAEDLVGGQDWRVEIPKAIKASDAIIICLSKNSINKEGFVQAEITFALEKALEIPPGRIFIIPARFEECEVPNTLERFHWVDLFEEDGYPRLMKSLKTRAGQLERATVEVPRPDEISPDLGSTTEDDKKREQELELKKLESQAIQAELRGDFWNARKTWYEIKRIDPLFPRVDIKLRELEREVVEMEATREKENRDRAEKAIQEKTLREAAGKARRERAERVATRKAALTKLIAKAIPFLRIIFVIGIFIGLLWAGSWAILKLPLFVSTPKPSATAALAPTSISPPSEITNKGVSMVLVSAGDFIMGSNISNDTKPVGKMSLDSFYIDKYEVTNALYKLCVNSRGCISPKRISSETRSYYYGYPEFDNFPVIFVDWNMARTYCEWRGARLPTEAEWEKAARGPGLRNYPWGDPLSCEKANYGGCTGDTVAVDSYLSGKSFYGAYNMAGNVAEWVSSLYVSYPYKWDINHENPNAVTARVLRGGSFNDVYTSISVFYRNHISPSYTFYSIGFRCAKDVNP